MGEYRRNAPAAAANANVPSAQANAQFQKQQVAKLANVVAERPKVQNSPAAADKKSAASPAPVPAPVAPAQDPQKAAFLQFLEKGRKEQAERDRALKELNVGLAADAKVAVAGAAAKPAVAKAAANNAANAKPLVKEGTRLCFMNTVAWEKAQVRFWSPWEFETTEELFSFLFRMPRFQSASFQEEEKILL